MSCSLITRIASRRKSGSKPSPTLRRYSSSATLTSAIVPSFVLDFHTHKEAPNPFSCQPCFTPPAETLSNRQTLGDYLDGWLITKKPTIEPTSWDRCEESFRIYIKPALGKVPLTKLTAQQIQQLYAQ